MPPSSGVLVRGERAAIDWSDSSYSDEDLLDRIEEHLPYMVERLSRSDGKAECSINLASNRLRGPEPIAKLLRRLREASVQVVTLRLHKNQLSDSAMVALVEHIHKGAKDHRPLLELHLSDNRLTEVGVRSLVEAAYRCSQYVAGKGTTDRRCRALWLRCENQRPPLPDPHGLLDRLAAEGCGVCLLPSKEYQHFGGKGRAQQEAAVHMHHAFAPRSEHRLLPAPEPWGKDKGCGKACGSRDWWFSEGKGKEGGQGRGKGPGPQKGGAENGHTRPRGVANYEEHKGKGKAILESWRNLGNRPQRPRDHHDEWEPDGWDEDASEPAGSDRPLRNQARASSSTSRPRSAWTANERQVATAEAPPKPSGDMRAWAEAPPFVPQQAAGALPSYPVGGAQGGREQAWDPGPAKWLESAANCVRWRLRNAEQLGLLLRSLAPACVPEADWLQMARFGSQCLLQHCTQRASVVAGSFVEDAAVYDLGNACTGELALASCFRRLQLHQLFGPDVLLDERSDQQCASLLCALYGELLDAPAMGEGSDEVNARKAAEWALLDFIFLLGTTRLMSAGAACNTHR